MNTTNLILKHEKAIECLKGIEYFQLKLNASETFLNQIPIDLSDVINKCKHNITIYTKCIERLKSYYIQHYTFYN